MNKKKILIVIFSTILSLLLITAIGFLVYVSNYEKANSIALEALNSTNIVTVDNNSDYISFEPEEYTNGLIFYPGGKVEAEAYANLMMMLAEEGILSIIIKMPFNLAMFNINGANKVIDKYDVDNWYLSGHSLGGVFASSYLEKNTSKFGGMIYLASYTTYDLSKTNLDVLSITASNDTVINNKSYEENKKNLPINTLYKEIDGGNHSNFGDYGLQKKDGISTISSQEQKEITITAILDFICN